MSMDLTEFTRTLQARETRLTVSDRWFSSAQQDRAVMVRLETVLLIWNKLISMQIMIIIMQMSIFADDERTVLMNIIILKINKCYGEGYTFKIFLLTVDH